jgi:hypothetical protein
MKKIIVKILLFLTFILFSVSAYWWYVNIPNAQKISGVSINHNPDSNIVESITSSWLNIIKSAKLIIQWLAILFVVYIGIQMIMSKWKDEEDLSSAKRQIMYTIIWLVFINIPWILYDALTPTQYNASSLTSWWINATSWTKNYDWWSASNIFFDTFNLNYILENNIIWFMMVIIAWLAILMIMYEWIKIMSSRWREEAIKEWKSKILYSVMALIFVSFIEAWKRFVFSWTLTWSWATWVSIFNKLTELALYFVWPVTIFFLTLAGYYYITSNWNKDKITKAKSIIVNTLIATVLLLVCYTFLADLTAFKITFDSVDY